jgi:hypothetical protein
MVSMVNIKNIGRFFVFIVVGFVTIIVGSFMIRGTMHMWDNQKDHKTNDDKD